MCLGKEKTENSLLEKQAAMSLHNQSTVKTPNPHIFIVYRL